MNKTDKIDDKILSFRCDEIVTFLAENYEKRINLAQLFNFIVIIVGLEEQVQN